MSWDKRTKATKDEWLTPPALLEALGPFDLDPCAPINPPWRTARRQFSIREDGLKQKWAGRVWLNPPYGGFGPQWMRRLAEHGNGIGLIFARTDTTWFQECARRASGCLFLRGRLRFFHVTGEESGSSAPAPSALLAFGKANAKALQRAGLKGLYYVRPE